jgi:elongation factor P hydroxylase
MSAVKTVAASAETRFDAARLEKVFNKCFAVSCNTRLYGGAQEPLYQPATRIDGLHALYYRHEYFASALHEAAHWCLAGETRRQQLDFGYWYAPEGRSVQQQQAFEAVERKPQALEWYFSKACAYRFQVSLDNLDLVSAGLHDSGEFKEAVFEQVVIWRDQGLPSRAAAFYRALCAEFGTVTPASQLQFALADLG